MRFFGNFSHKHIPSTPLRGQPRSASIPHATASSARVMQTRPHPRAATLSASFRDEVLSAPPRPVAPYQAQARERPRRGGGRGAGGRTQAMQALHPPPPRRGQWRGHAFGPEPRVWPESPRKPNWFSHGLSERFSTAWFLNWFLNWFSKWHDTESECNTLF